jgi:hypothetical protein
MTSVDTNSLILILLQEATVHIYWTNFYWKNCVKRGTMDYVFHYVRLEIWEGYLFGRGFHSVD